MPSQVLPAPTSGWNVRDSAAQLRPDEAVVLDNWFPDTGKVKARPGYAEYITSAEFTAITVSSDAVETIFELNAAGKRLGACCTNNKIIEITTGTPVDRTGGATITSDRWQWVQAENGAGASRVLLFNGVDAPLAVTESGGNLSVATLTISGTGLTVANIIGGTVYKERLIVWMKESQDFWYSAHQTPGGTMTKFPLSRISRTGGDIVSVRVWSQDSGQNADDLIVFLFNSGDVAVYQWSDPSNTSVNLVGQYRISPPLADRACAEIGGDVVVVTRAGYELLSRAIPTGQTSVAALSDKINPAVTALIGSAGVLFGWQVIHYPDRNMIIVNAPISSSEFHQHVFNSHTGAACRFTGINAFCWGMFNNDLYFGGTHKVLKFAAGSTSDAGNGITSDCSQAWNYLRSPSQTKRVTAVAPAFASNGDFVGFDARVGYDFTLAPAPTVGLAGSITGTAWGSPWGSPWSNTVSGHQQEWVTTEGEGFSVSPRIRVLNAEQQIEWIATNVLFEMGGQL